MNKLLILGTGSHARKVYDAARSAGLEVLGFYDENRQKNDRLCGLEIYHSVDNLKKELFIIAIGDAQVRKRLYAGFFSSGWQPATIVHPKATVSADAQVGPGSVVCAGAIIEAHSKVGVACIVDIGVLIDHNVSVGNYCHLKLGSMLESYSIVNDFSIIDAGKIVSRI